MQAYFSIPARVVFLERITVSLFLVVLIIPISQKIL